MLWKKGLKFFRKYYEIGECFEILNNILGYDLKVWSSTSVTVQNKFCKLIKRIKETNESRTLVSKIISKLNFETQTALQDELNEKCGIRSEESEESENEQADVSENEENNEEVDKEDIDEDQLNNSKDSTYRPETQNSSSSKDD